jgi:hypothetical protein
MNRLRSLLLYTVLTVASLQASAACYTVFDRYSRVIFQSASPPVDMSVPLHETVPRRFPGGHMVVSDAICPPLPIVTPAVPTDRGPPLLTQRRTAQAMKVPYQVLSGEIVLVQPEHVPASLRSKPISPGANVPAKPDPDAVITQLRDLRISSVQ